MVICFFINNRCKKGLSALQIQRNLNISYPTALSMCHKIRELMMIENNKVELSNIVEMDETFVGGKPRKQANYEGLKQKRQIEYDLTLRHLKEEGFKIEKGKKKMKSDIGIKRGRGSEKKTPVVGMVSRDGEVIAQSNEKSNLQ
ncbi:MAG: IS1595 family transposase [Bacteroidetes bacterium]|nr:IS1595 family transposase [Bacteroidota bacterium]